MWASQAPGGVCSRGALGWGSGPWVRIGIETFRLLALNGAGGSIEGDLGRLRQIPPLPDFPCDQRAECFGRAAKGIDAVALEALGQVARIGCALRRERKPFDHRPRRS